MAINYQQILKEMNRPERKARGGLRRALVPLALVLGLAGGGYALWTSGYAQDTWARAHVMARGLLARFGVGTDAGAFPAAPASETAPAVSISTSSSAPVAPPAGLAASLVPAAPPAFVPAPAGPIDVAQSASLRPTRVAPVVPVAAAVPAVAAVPVAAVAPAAPAVPVAAVAVAPAASASSAQPMDLTSAPEALSSARAQIRVIDGLLTSDPTAALARAEALLATGLDDDDAAEAAYRRGYAARLLRDEAKAEESWQTAAAKYPATHGGRFSALALADTWHHHYAGENTQTSRWDDIQILYSQVLGTDDAPFLPEDVKTVVKMKLNRLNDSLFFGTAPSKLARYHKVETGELLGAVANKYRVDYESISRINGINPNRIRAGMDLKLIVGDVSVVVRKNTARPEIGPTVTWFLDGRWVREYPACVGDGIKTPAGTYQLTSRERDPSWTNPLNGQLLPNDHPDNILGSRWMAMKGMNTQGLGIHGTTVDDSIPGYTSAGCVRLLNRDVEELFSYARIGGRVTILE